MPLLAETDVTHQPAVKQESRIYQLGAVVNWQLSPSDLVFLYEECSRCFYLKVRGLLKRPRTPMPKIFTTIDITMKEFLDGKRTETLCCRMPKGTFRYAERWVASAPVLLPGCSSTVSFRGKFDDVLELDIGGYGLVDLKTCHRRDEHIPLYSRQLHAYAWCLENPAPGALSLSPISDMGLLVFEPDMFFKGALWSGGLCGDLNWIAIQRDNDGFREFLQAVVMLLESPTAPPPNGCSWCRYQLALL
jgi:hypothetical protein